MKRAIAVAVVLALNLVALSAVPSAQTAEDRTSLPTPAPPFKGTIGKTYKDSKEDFPTPVKAPAGAPNIVLILLDDVGFGHTSTFGGPIQTPNLDKLAARGARYNRFHTTAICSPTRAALLSGRNHHQCGVGTITELCSGYPGYTGIWSSRCACIAEILRQFGYSTAMFGKWHLTPVWETSPIGPFDRWPSGRGFEYSYGFHGGETSQWEPNLFRNTTPVEAPAKAEQGYHLDRDLADEAIGWIRKHQSVAPEKPYFAYYATGSAHAPIHGPKQWADKYKGKFNQGWDRLREETFERQEKLGVIPANAKLTPRHKEIPSWESRSPDEKRLLAREMEVFAGFLSHTDHQIGRLLDYVASLPDADNTMIMFIVGDNGPSGEGGMVGALDAMQAQNGYPDTVERQLKKLAEWGGPGTEPHIAVSWAWAASTPFGWMKRVPSHLGGTRNPMIVVWPKQIKDNQAVRSQFLHVIDVAPTICDAVGIQYPDSVNGVKQTPLAGVSFLKTFADPKAPEVRTTQYFEVGGHRAIYHKGWMASARHGVPWELIGSLGNFDRDKWELYDLSKDFSQADDLAAKQPDKLKALQLLFDAEAKKYDVFPLDDRAVERVGNPLQPSLIRGKTKFVYYPGAVRITEANAPPTKMRSHSITAEVEIPKEDAEGVVVACGGPAGYTIYVKGGKLIYEYNLFGLERYTITSSQDVPTGKVTLGFEYEQQGKEPGSGGVGRLYVDGKKVGEGKLEKQIPFIFSASESLDIGMDLGSTVSHVYHDERPFAFSGKIEKVTFELK
ncbi:MAG: arylsulfatase [Planctomycetes bacterium]|nr:arylsulfatase [Planctomycetota bacterium]